MSKAKTYTLKGKSTVQDRDKGYKYEKPCEISATDYGKLNKRHKRYFELVGDDSSEEEESSEDEKKS